VFDLDKRYTYFQLVETDPPYGYEMPRGQWRIFLANDPDTTDPNSPHYDTEGWENVGGAWYIRIRYIGDPTIPAFAFQPGDTGERGAGEWYVGNRPILELPLMGGTGRNVFLIGGALTLLLGMGLLAYQVNVGRLALADGAESGTCAACAHGTPLSVTKVFCMRRGIMPPDSTCAKYDESG
jgi:hypothetical protein